MKIFFKEKWLKIIIGATLIVLLPIWLTIKLYPLKEVIIFDGKNYQQSDFKIEDFFKKEPTFKSLIADALSTSLSLDWYKIIIQNNSIQEDSGCLEAEPAMVKFDFLKGDPRKYKTNIREGEVNSGFSYFESKYPEYYIKSGEKIFFIASSRDDFSINGGLMFSGDCNLQMKNRNFKIGKLQFDYIISRQPYLGAWFVKLFIISLFCVFLFSSCISIINWIFGGKNKKY